jgi:hypothetical protein
MKPNMGDVGIKIIKLFTWNHRALIILLSRKIGTIHTPPNVHERSDLVHHHMYWSVPRRKRTLFMDGNKM